MPIVIRSQVILISDYNVTKTTMVSYDTKMRDRTLKHYPGKQWQNPTKWSSNIWRTVVNEGDFTAKDERTQMQAKLSIDFCTKRAFVLVKTSL